MTQATGNPFREKCLSLVAEIRRWHGISHLRLSQASHTLERLGRNQERVTIRTDAGDEFLKANTLSGGGFKGEMGFEGWGF